MKTTIPRSVEWGIIVVFVELCFLFEIVGEDAGGAFDLGGAGAGLVVFGRAGGGDIAVCSLLVALDAEDLSTDQAAIFFF